MTIPAVPMKLSSGLDPKSVYHPPLTLQMPGRISSPNTLELGELSQPESPISSSSSRSSIGSSHGIQKEFTEQDSSIAYHQSDLVSKADIRIHSA